MPKVFWSVLLERSTTEPAVQSLLDVAMQAGQRGYTRLRWPFTRTDIARNSLIHNFLSVTSDPQDVLVMLDNDHLMPPLIIDQLIGWNEGVVGALAFRRGEPYFPCVFVREPDGFFHVAKEFPERGLYVCTLVGTGAVAIRRWVFEALDAAGFAWPYFRYTYPKGDRIFPSEDIYFGESCEAAGIPHHVDTTICIPHLTQATIDENSWQDFQTDHPQINEPGFNWDAAMRANIDEALDHVQAQ